MEVHTFRAEVEEAISLAEDLRSFRGPDHSTTRAAYLMVSGLEQDLVDALKTHPFETAGVQQYLSQRSAVCAALQGGNIPLARDLAERYQLPLDELVKIVHAKDHCFTKLLKQLEDLLESNDS